MSLVTTCGFSWSVWTGVENHDDLERKATELLEIERRKLEAEVETVVGIVLARLENYHPRPEFTTNTSHSWLVCRKREMLDICILYQWLL